MQDYKHIFTTHPIKFMLSSSMSLNSEIGKMEMSLVSYELVVGSLIYVNVCIRPNITQVVRVVSRFMENPGREYLTIIKRILRYFKGTLGVALCFKGSKLVIRGYVDKRRYNIGYVFTLVEMDSKLVIQVTRCCSSVYYRS